jgi:hypothetical protein
MKNELDLLRQESQQLQNPASALEIHVVDKNDIFYTRGRYLAKSVYRNKWNTENLIDHNDYGVVIVSQGKVIANMNIQIGSTNRPLNSEKFFAKEHWKHYFDVPASQTLELSGLSIPQDVDSELRTSLLMILSLSAYNIAMSLGIKVCTTVQLQMLIRILTRRLYLPFFTSEFVTDIKGSVPNDDYWNRMETPKIYYLDLVDSKTIEIFNQFFCYLNFQGINTAFLPRFNQQQMTFTSFRNRIADI